ncbi:MAG: aminodeoxychorismate synthase component I [Campylobacteraceae bacterium]
MFRFDFEGKTRIFENPIKTIFTCKSSEVLEKLKEAEEECEKGYFVAGFLSYEALRDFYKITNKFTYKFPLLHFEVFDGFKEEDSLHVKEESLHLDLQSNITFKEYEKNISKIQEEIKAGNTYQVNYTTKLIGEFKRDAYDYYMHQLKEQEAKYCAYLEIKNFKIISISPELFFKLEKGKLTTKPMKGTTKRGLWFEDDLKQIEKLYSDKNRAENLMITDLLRNDLGVISKAGSVKVEKLFEAEKYPTIWQLTSTITANIKKSVLLADIFKALFPCGSITGAPKLSTMKIINELEQSPREIYCGTLGFIAPQKEAIFNIPIRTLLVDEVKKEANYGVGGGVTLDSTPKDEYEEILNKSAILKAKNLKPKELLESILLENGEYFLLDLHVKRLMNSAEYFDFKVDIEVIKEALLKEITDYKKYKVRLLVDKNGNFKIEKNELKDLGLKSVKLSNKAMDNTNVFLYHKTTRRDFYPKTDVGEGILLYSERGEITEFTNANVAFLIDDIWLTPAQSSGLLGGVMREKLLNNGFLKEKIIKIDDIKKATKIAFINSVRKWLDVTNLVKL